MVTVGCMVLSELEKNSGQMFIGHTFIRFNKISIIMRIIIGFVNYIHDLLLYSLI